MEEFERLIKYDTSKKECKLLYYGFKYLELNFSNDCKDLNKFLINRFSRFNIKRPLIRQRVLCRNFNHSIF